MTDETPQKKGPGRPRQHADTAARVAAYRERKAAGAVRVSIWLSPAAHQLLSEHAAALGCSLGEAASHLLLQAAPCS